MMKTLALITLFLIMLPEMVLAKTLPKRSVGFEWEAIEGVNTYEIELVYQPRDKDETTQTFTFKTDEAKWSGKLSPGMYTMRLRSRDKRGVPGEWSEAQDFPVNLEMAEDLVPKLNSKVKASQSTEEPVEFSWKEVPGAVNYEITVNGPNSFSKKATSDRAQTTILLPVGQEYSWTVTGRVDDKLVGDPLETPIKFTLLGPAFDSPNVEQPATEYVRFLAWSPMKNVSRYDVTITRFDPKSSKWKIYFQKKDFDDTEVEFQKKWPGGKYKIKVIATAPNWESSKPTIVEFDVAPGSRSLAAENRALVKQSIDRTKDWYFVASYLVTMIDYKATNLDKGSGPETKAFGGTGRLGAGFLNSRVPWGFLGIVDLSGFIIGDKNYTYPAMEAQGLWKFDFDEWGELRLSGGLYYKEIPEILGDPFTGAYELAQLSTYGPHYGGEYWFSLTPKLGVQFNARFYSSTGGKTPTGQPIVPTLSSQIGVLGSYRIFPKITGLMGYALRTDKVSYKAKNSIAGKSTNETSIVGNYLNLYLEWDF